MKTREASTNYFEPMNPAKKVVVKVDIDGFIANHVKFLSSNARIRDRLNVNS